MNWLIFIYKILILDDTVSYIFIDICYYKKIILQLGCEKLRHFVQQSYNSKVLVYKIDKCHHDIFK